jgi:hypothetical protein
MSKGKVNSLETAEANLLEQKNLVQAANQAGNQRCIQEGRLLCFN